MGIRNVYFTKVQLWLFNTFHNDYNMEEIFEWKNDVLIHSCVLLSMTGASFTNYFQVNSEPHQGVFYKANCAIAVR